MVLSKRMRSCLYLVLLAFPACSSRGEPIDPPMDGGSTADGSPETPDAGEPDAPDPNGDGNVDAVCNEYARRDCDDFVRCLPRYLAEEYGSYAACLDRSKEDCIRMIALPGSSWTPPALLACAKAFEGRECNSFASIAPCVSKPGTLANEAGCLSNAQCASAYCWRDIGADCGVCRDKVPDGGRCTRDANCQSSTCVSMSCFPRLKEGDPCARLNECPQDLTCNAGVCQQYTWVPRGGNCSAPTALCEDDLSCDNDVCVDATIVEIGQACGLLPDGRFATCRASLCDERSVCVRKTPVGAPCANASECEGSALCHQGTCKAAAVDVCNSPSAATFVEGRDSLRIAGEARDRRQGRRHVVE